MAPREEESLIDDMREAIRADRERAAVRAAKPAEQAAPPVEAPPPAPPKLGLRRIFGR